MELMGDVKFVIGIHEEFSSIVVYYSAKQAQAAHRHLLREHYVGLLAIHLLLIAGPLRVIAFTSQHDSRSGSAQAVQESYQADKS